MVKFLGACAQRKLLHILRCGVPWFVQMSRESCAIALKVLLKMQNILRVFFKSFRANPNVSASLRGSAEMHL
jgi:hypothetical protein